MYMYSRFYFGSLQIADFVLFSSMYISLPSTLSYINMHIQLIQRYQDNSKETVCKRCAKSFTNFKIMRNYI